MATAQQARMIFKDLGIDPNNYKIRSIASLNKDFYKRSVLKKAKELGKKPSELTNVEYMKAYSLPGTQIGLAIRLGEAAKRAEKRKDYDSESYFDQPTIFQNWNTWSKEDQEELIPVLINALALADLTLGGPGLYTNLNNPGRRSSDRHPLLALDYEEARRDYEEQFKLVFGPQTVENPLDQGPLMALKINELEEGYTNSENLYEASAIYYLRGRQELKSSSALLGVLGVLGGGVIGYQYARQTSMVPAKVATGAGIGYLISKFLSR